LNRCKANLSLIVILILCMYITLSAVDSQQILADSSKIDLGILAVKDSAHTAFPKVYLTDSIGTSSPQNDIINQPKVSKDTISISNWKFQSNTSLFLSFSEGIGVGKIISNSKRTEENFLMIAAGVGFIAGLGGYADVYYQKNVFLKPVPIGTYFKLEFGATYAMLPFSTDGTDNGKEIFLPHVAIGVGKSHRIGRQSYFRYSADVGIKMSPITLNLSFIL
jgi:hypothetical protein